MTNSITRPSRPTASHRDRFAAQHQKPNQYRDLLTSLQSLGFGNGVLKTIGITSPNRGEGVTTVSSNLALYAATLNDARIILVDANSSNPNLHRMFDVNQSPGLAELLNEAAIESECVHDLSTRPFNSWPTGFKRYFRLATGNAKLTAWNHETLAAPLLSVLPAGSENLRDSDCNMNDDGFLEAVCCEFDLVIVDLPAINSPATCGIPMSNLDGILVVLEAEQTSDIVAHKCLRQIQASGANLLGVVLNKCRTRLPKWIDKKLGD